MGHDYEGKTEKHASQVDAAKGFGGKYGVQKDRQDKVGLVAWSVDVTRTPSICFWILFYTSIS